jgi:head-tail adaptor
MLPAGELAAMRAELERSLPDTAQVRRRSLAGDGMGGQAETWATVATVACRVAPTANMPEEFTNGGRLVSTSWWRLTFPAGTDVRAADRVVALGRTFEVVAGGGRSREIGRRVWAAEVA